MLTLASELGSDSSMDSYHRFKNKKKIEIAVKHVRVAVTLRRLNVQLDGN